MTEASLKGQCLCGAVRIRISGGHDPRIGACHCRMCQRWSGGLFLCFDAPAASVTVTGPIACHASSAFAERAFCSICGSHLWMRQTDAENADYELMPGLFDAARNWPLRSEIYVDRALNCIRIEGDHRRNSRAEYEAAHPHLTGDLT